MNRRAIAVFTTYVGRTVIIRAFPLIVLFALVVSACSPALQSDDREPATTTIDDPVTETPISAEPPQDGAFVAPADTAVLRNQFGYEFPDPPQIPTEPVSPDLAADVDDLLTGIEIEINFETLNRIGASGDARVAWLITDIMRLIRPGQTLDRITGVFESLTRTSLEGDPVAARSQWQSATDHLIAWDLPAVEPYVGWKARLLTLVDERWRTFFDDADATVDWRFVSWGGVLIDDRPLGDNQPCVLGCIPALDDPGVTPASGGDWYPDDAIVFGITVGDESRAYPKNIMEVHEMVNDTLGGRRLGIPYCTLCGSAQAYLTDEVPEGVEIPVLRTSGLLSRSNKVMYDLTTQSIIDTFTGEARSGSLQDVGLVLPQVSVVTSTWRAWREAHPSTTIVARDGGIGRVYDPDPLGGRDDNGAIFPIGDVDERLPAQERVLGVLVDGSPAVAVPVAAAIAHLEAGGSITFDDRMVVLDASGIRVASSDGSDAGGHEAFWFAWSQFHPDTLVWQPPG